MIAENSRQIKIFFKTFFERVTFLSREMIVLAKSLSESDLVHFGYKYPDGSYKRHLAMVVKTAKAPKSLYVSNKNNLLITAFRLDAVSPDTASLIINKLYTMDVLSNDPQGEKLDYLEKNFNGLRAILGSESYRTYNTGRMIGPRRIE